MVQGVPMRFKWILIPAVLGLLLAWRTLSWAGDQTVDETDLLPPGFGEAYEVHLGVDGYLYLSDNSNIGDLRRVDPNTGAYTRFSLGSPVLDAKPDLDGGLWWVDGSEYFNHLDLSTNQLTTWILPLNALERNLRGLDFDADGRVWMTEFFGENSSLFRFDLGSSELCTYTIVGGNSSSYYILHDDGKLWLGNWDKQRIYRIDPQSQHADYWEIGDSNAWPKGLALDANGKLWWADQGLGAVAYLDPAADQIRVYPLPEGTGSNPQMITIRPEGLWYTENLSGTIGLLDPTTAVGETYTVTTGLQAVTSECGMLEPAFDPFTLYPSTGTFAWDSYSLPPTVDSGGWLVYQLPDGLESVKPKAYGIAFSGDSLWVTDQGRQKLVRFTLDEIFNIYLPLVIK